MATTETLYILEIKIPDEDSQRIPVQGRVTIGSSADVDICVEDYGLAPKHCIFKDSNEVLTVQNTGGEGAVIVGKQKLGHGKMYIVDKGDSIQVGELTIVIRTEEAEVEFVEEETSTELTQKSTPENKSIVQKLTGLFRRNKSEENEDDDDTSPDVQVIDHSDEEEDEEEKPARSVKATGALGKVTPAKVKISPYLKKHRAGILIRFFGLLLNLAAVYSVYLYLLPELNVEGHFQKAFELLTPHFDKYSPLLAPHVPENILTFITSYTTIKILSIFIALELISALLFGCSLGLFFLGATGFGGFIGKRFKAFIRTLLSFFTSPLLITELPALIKRRTFKEVLSFSQIEKRSNPLSFILCLTIAPLGILAAFLWPIANDPILLKMPEYFESPLQVKKKGRKEANFKSTSSYFGLKVSFFKKNTVEFIPSSEKTGLILYLFDLRKGSQVSITKHKEINLNSQFKTMYEKNPFFSSFSPGLFKLIGQQKDSDTVFTEITNLTRDSLGITPQRLHQILLQHGPYVNGLMDIRLSILSSLGITNKFKTTSFKAGRKDYLLIEEEATGINQTMYLLPIGMMKLTPIKVVFKSKDRLLANYAIDNLIKKSKPLSKIYKFSPKSVQDWNALTVLDTYASKKSTINSKVANGVGGFYESLIGILKSPEGISAKAKVRFTRLLQKSLKRSASKLSGTPLASELENLLKELPEAKKGAKQEKKEE